MAQVIIDFDEKHEEIIKAFKDKNLEGEGSKATVVKKILESLNIENEQNSEE